MSPAALFSIGSTLAMVSWLALGVALFLRPIRHWTWRITGLAVPAVLAVAYALLIARGFAEAPDGGFGSIEAVRTLFTSDAALTAGWLLPSLAAARLTLRCSSRAISTYNRFRSSCDMVYLEFE